MYLFGHSSGMSVFVLISKKDNNPYIIIKPIKKPININFISNQSPTNLNQRMEYTCLPHCLWICHLLFFLFCYSFYQAVPHHTVLRISWFWPLIMPILTPERTPLILPRAAFTNWMWSTIRLMATMAYPPLPPRL